MTVEELERLRARVPAARNEDSESQIQTAKPKDDTSATRETKLSGRMSPTITDMITTALDRMESAYLVEPEFISGIWDNGFFHFSSIRDLEDEDETVIQVHGTWERVLDAESFADALIFVNTWNANNVWPKAYVELEKEEEIVAVFGEVVVDLGRDIKQSQVEHTVRHGIATSVALFDEAGQEFPDARAHG